MAKKIMAFILTLLSSRKLWEVHLRTEEKHLKRRRERMVPLHSTRNECVCIVPFVRSLSTTKKVMRVKF